MATSKQKPGPKGLGAKASTSPNWTGALAQRLPRGEAMPSGAISVLSNEVDASALAAERQRWALQTGLADAELVVPKMLLLLDHYGIGRDQPEQWFVLALRLAMDHVPGFQGELRRGRPNEWSPEKLALLRLAIDQKLHERKAAGLPCTVHDASRFVAADSRFANVFGRRQAAKTLENRYRDALTDGLAEAFSWLAGSSSIKSRSELIDALLTVLQPQTKAPRKE